MTAGKGGAQQKAQQRHAGLEHAEPHAAQRGMARFQLAHRKPLADGHRESVHGKAKRDQKKIQQTHTKFPLYRFARKNGDKKGETHPTPPYSRAK